MSLYPATLALCNWLNCDWNLWTETWVEHKSIAIIFLLLLTTDWKKILIIVEIKVIQFAFKKTWLMVYICYGMAVLQGD